MKTIILGPAGRLGRFATRFLSEHNGEAPVLIPHDVLGLKRADVPEGSVILNCAAITDIERCDRDREACLRVHTLGPMHVAEIAAVQGARLINFSSDHVLMDPAMVNYYGYSKLLMERLVADYPCAHVVRTSWLYVGYGGDFIDWMRKRAGRVVNLVNNRISVPTSAKFLMECLTTMMKSNQLPKVINVVPNGSCSRHEWGVVINELLNLKCKINPVDSSFFDGKISPRPEVSVLDNAILNRSLDVQDWQEYLQSGIDFGDSI